MRSRSWKFSNGRTSYSLDGFLFEVNKVKESVKTMSLMKEEIKEWQKTMLDMQGKIQPKFNDLNQKFHTLNDKLRSHENQLRVA